MSYIIISTFSSPFLSLLVVSTPPCIHHLPFSFLLGWAGESSWYQEDPAGLEPGACELLSQLLLEHNNFLQNLLTVHTEQQQQQQKNWYLLLFFLSCASTCWLARRSRRRFPSRELTVHCHLGFFL